MKPPIYYENLCVRVVNALINAGFNTREEVLKELLPVPSKKIWSVPNLGKKSIIELNEWAKDPGPLPNAAIPRTGTPAQIYVEDRYLNNQWKSVEIRLEAFALRAEGMTFTDISKKIGISTGMIVQYVNEGALITRIKELEEQVGK